MRRSDNSQLESRGPRHPAPWPLAPSLIAPSAFCAGVLACALLAGCSDQEESRTLPIVQVGMTRQVAPIFDDGELTIYEVKKGVSFPIVAPSASEMSALDAAAVEPYGRAPWVKSEDVGVQVSFTLSNLDEQEHVVEVLVDPWNEFGRYYPGLQLTDAENQEFMPNFSGIDQRYVVPGRSKGDGSRVHGTYTFADLNETAVDLSTVMALIADPPAKENPDDPDEEDPTVIYANHAFHWQNRSYDDRLIAAWIPERVAGLTGLDLGFRTYEKATVTIEYAIEIVDRGEGRVRKEDENDALLPPTEAIITVGTAPP